MLPIPIGDATRSRTFPVVTVAFIILNVLVFLFELSLGTGGFRAFTMAFGNIPFEMVTGQDIPPRGPSPIYLTLLTAMFMHGGFGHLLGNMLYLWVFGDNVEDSMGHVKYLLFYLVCGVAASLAHIFSDPGSRIPAVGASGAISGVLGAYMMLHPTGQIRTLWIFLIFIRVIYLPAWLLLGAWFIFQLLPGLQTLGGGQESGIAFWAHIGGFVAGAVLIFLFRDPQRGPAAEGWWDSRRGYY
jgi:membrane associated rhomboid family serine protease